MAKIEWTESATKDLERLDKLVSRRILRKLDWFSNNFERIAPELLSGELNSTFKLRVGDWRVIYTVEGDTTVIQSVGHRREIYKIK